MADSSASPPGGSNCRLSASRRTKLKGSQLERKRKVDREAQAALRSRTKSRIAHLESLVKVLGESDRRDEQLVTQLNGSRKQMENLVDTLANIRRIVDAALESTEKEVKHDFSGSSTCSPPGNVSAVLQPDSNVKSQPNLLDNNASMILDGTIDSRLHEADAAAFANGQMSSLYDEIDYQDPFMSEGRLHCASRVASTGAETHFSRNFESLHDGRAHVPTEISTPREDEMHPESWTISVSSSDFRKHRPEGALWYLADKIMTHAISYRSHSLNQDAENEDIAVRAILNGWPVVEEKYPLDSGWKMIRQLDQTLYAHCGALERLAILRMTRLMYNYHVNPQVPIPQFMTARPSERHIPHQRLVEYFVWPGLREHVLFSPTKYAKNKFAEAFSNGFRFLWPLDFSDAFAKDKVTGLYSYSPRFVEGQGFLRCWTMHAEFFRQYPELKGDMPVYDSSRDLSGSPLSLSYPSGAGPHLDRLRDQREQDQAESVPETEASGRPFEMEYVHSVPFDQDHNMNSPFHPTLQPFGVL